MKEILGFIMCVVAFIWGVALHFTPVDSVTPCSAFWHEMTLIYYLWPHMVGIFLLSLVGQIMARS